MARRVMVGLLLMGFAWSAHAQLPDTLWTRTFGGAYTDYAEAVACAPDGGFLAVGGTYDGQTDVYAVRTDSNGQMLWSRHYGGLRADYATAVAATPDGGWIVAGGSNSQSPGPDYWGDAYLLRLNADGDTLWTRTFGGGRDDDFYGVAVTADGGYLAVGATNSYGPGVPFRNNSYLVRGNTDGDTLWTRVAFEWQGSEAYAIQAVANGGYVVTGKAYPILGNPPHPWLLRLSEEGDTLWQQLVTSPESAVSWALTVMPDGGFGIAGSGQTPEHEHQGVYLARTDSQGNTLWSRTYYYPVASGEVWAYGVQALSDGGLAVTGPLRWYTPEGNDPDLFLLRVDAQGNALGWQVLDQSDYDWPSAMTGTPDGGLIITGSRSTMGTGLGTQLWLVRYGAVPVSVTERPEFIPDELALAAYPNPFNSATEIRYAVPRSSHVSLKVFDVMGREVCVLVDGVVSAGEGRVVWEAGGVASGVYFVRLVCGERGMTRKVLLVR